jgi:hypothetical protein
MSSLYNLSDEYRYLYDLFTNGDIDEETLNDNLEGISFSERLEEKAIGYCQVDITIGSQIDIIDKEIKRLTELKRVAENGRKRLRERLKSGMELMGIDKVDTPLFKLSISKNPPAVQIEDESKLPDKYMKVSYTVDKTAIKNDLKNGIEIDGCTLTTGTSLRIK